MPIDPDLRPLMPFGHPPKVIEDPGLFRAQMNQNNDDAFDMFGCPGPRVAERQILSIGSPFGNVRAILYRPATDGPHPVHIFLHGGGWVINSASSKHSEAVSRHRCVHADCIVISVDYRKAPEHLFPAPVYDVISVIDWVRDNSAEIGALPGAISIGGQSSGANIAAAATIMLRDEARDDIDYQLLEVPALDLTHSRPRDEGEELPLSMSDVRTFCALYLGSGKGSDPLASPLLTRDLKGLPSAYIAVAEYDVLRGDGEWYAQRLHNADVPVELYLGEGHVHISPSMTGLLASARVWQEAATGALRTANTRLRDATR
ncbi:alpha/beta hydrolase [Streptomyces sp. VNUA24]|uniref:alpha/beta hydrolase n=1 Tax=Streptomyces sp. VNUA24 TaxID=3031131 RepID=UPI0023B77CCE|nr:alpha/beta hydrolase [Streptomyces sp. VNUA24]WEH19915.1 alpha/beta hydrolase [Streptomyces sp. VNUA24]